MESCAVQPVQDLNNGTVAEWVRSDMWAVHLPTLMCRPMQQWGQISRRAGHTLEGGIACGGIDISPDASGHVVSQMVPVVTPFFMGGLQSADTFSRAFWCTSPCICHSASQGMARMHGRTHWLQCQVPEDLAVQGN